MTTIESTIVKPIDAIIGWIGEYESKYDKPTLDGFQLYLERLKQRSIKDFNIQKGMRFSKKKRTY